MLGLSLAGRADQDEATPPALAELHQRVATGDASAPLDLGRRYVTAKGIPPDERAALRWIGNAAERGEREARALEPGLKWN